MKSNRSRYLRDLRRLMPVYGKSQREYLHAIDQSIKDYCNSHPNPTYEEYASAFFSTIMFSIGHFQKGIFDPRNGNYQVVFTFLFFIIVIYFQLYSYFGIYLEAYRINSLKHGNSYEIRMLRRLKREEKDYTSKSGKDGMNVVSEENKILSTHN